MSAPSPPLSESLPLPPSSDVVAAAALEDVVAEDFPQRVAARVADEQVVVVRTVDALDADEMVALGGAVGAGARRQAHRDPGRGVVVIGPIDAGTAVEVVGPQPAGERIVATEAVDRVVPAVAVDDVEAVGHPVGGVEGLGKIGSIHDGHGPVPCCPSPPPRQANAFTRVPVARRRRKVQARRIFVRGRSIAL